MPTGFLPMTITSAKGRVDFAAFGLQPEDLASLRAVAREWSAAVDTAFAASGGDVEITAFVAETRALPDGLADLAWQDRWLHCWQRVYCQGVPSSMLFAVMNAALDHCGLEIFSSGQASRLQVELLSLLRRAVLALLGCAVDLEEEARLLAGGVPDEMAALRCLRELAGEGWPLAVLSISLTNQEAFVHLSASDLQSLPALVVGQLQKTMRARDRIFTGRDGEWLLVLPEVHSMTQPALAGAHVERQFSQALRLPSSKNLVFDVAIGAAMLPEHAANAEALLAASRLARWGLLANRQTFGWYHQDIQADWNKRFDLAAEFKTALDQEALQFYIQPQVEATTGCCVGGELLLRWQRTSGEWVAPPRMMEIVDENGWRRQFTDWALRDAMRISSELVEAGCDFRLSLNLTADDLLDEDLVEMIVQRLETWQSSGERFTLELTESAMMLNQERCLATLVKLRELGFRLALDDFGTGYSSLSHLVNLPIDELKIDRSFIIAMDRSEEYLRIVRTIIDLAWDLDMVPLAEGVEEKAQVEQLQLLGCNHIQGFYYARPMPQSELVAWCLARQA